MFGESFLNLVRDTFPNAEIEIHTEYESPFRITGYYVVHNGVTFSVQFHPGNYNDCPRYPDKNYEFYKSNTAECAYWTNFENTSWDETIKGHLDMWDVILYMCDAFGE